MTARKTTRRRKAVSATQEPIEEGISLEAIPDLRLNPGPGRGKYKRTKKQPNDLKMQLALELIQCARDLLK